MPFDADHETVACAFPAIAATLEGTLGPAAGITAAEAAEAAELPTVFVATTRNVYDVPLVSPVTVQLTPEVEHVRLPGVDVTVYEVTGSPFATDAVHDTVDEASPRAAVTPVGAEGAAAGVAELDGADAAELPAAERAMTVTVYAVPFVSPVIAQVTAVVVVHVRPPGVAVTV